MHHRRREQRGLRRLDERRLGLLAAAIVLTLTRGVHADPQVSLGLQGGGGWQGVGTGGGPAISLGGRGDVLWLRNRNGEMALGPYVAGGTVGFRSADAGGGIEWLLPVTSDVPMVLSAGAFARGGDPRGWGAGWEGGMFLGSRSYNFHSWYGMAIGGFATARMIPAWSDARELIVGLQVDAEILVLPALLLWGAVSGR